MTNTELSTIAQLLFADQRTVDFARIVSELEMVLARLRGKEVTITWDCDDLVTFDVPETRILLSWAEINRQSFDRCLSVAVGPNPKSPVPEMRAEHDVLCSRLVERIQARYQPLAVQWQQVEGAISADDIDDLAEALNAPSSQSLPPIDSILESLSRADQQMAEARANLRDPRAVRTPELSRIATHPAAAEKPARATPAPRRPSRQVAVKRITPQTTLRQAFPEATNDRPDLPLPKSIELARLRAALYPVELTPEEAAEAKALPSTQMRLAAHCMNATLIVVYAPLGAAVMTYSILRGEDMRFSARVMALAGTFFALAQTPVGQTMAAMARSIG